MYWAQYIYTIAGDNGRKQKRLIRKAYSETGITGTWIKHQ